MKNDLDCSVEASRQWQEAEEIETWMDKQLKRITRLESQVKELEDALSYYKGLVTSDQKYTEGQMTGHLACKQMADVKIADLRGCLKRLEWSSIFVADLNQNLMSCPACKAIRGYGHASDCWLHEVLKEGEL